LIGAGTHDRNYSIRNQYSTAFRPSLASRKSAQTKVSPNQREIIKNVKVDSGAASAGELPSHPSQLQALLQPEMTLLEEQAPSTPRFRFPDLYACPLLRCARCLARNRRRFGSGITSHRRRPLGAPGSLSTTSVRITFPTDKDLRAARVCTSMRRFHNDSQRRGPSPARPRSYHALNCRAWVSQNCLTAACTCTALNMDLGVACVDCVAAVSGIPSDVVNDQMALNS